MKKILSKIMALIYLYHEFGNVNIKVTTVLDSNNCWTGKVILEQTNEEAKDDAEFAKFYTLAYCEKENENE